MTVKRGTKLKGRAHRLTTLNGIKQCLDCGLRPDWEGWSNGCSIYLRGLTEKAALAAKARTRAHAKKAVPGVKPRLQNVPIPPKNLKSIASECAKLSGKEAEDHAQAILAMRIEESKQEVVANILDVDYGDLELRIAAVLGNTWKA